ncbi:MAG: hypothetical protein ACPGSI_19060 [Pikeienuella sp.]
MFQNRFNSWKVRHKVNVSEVEIEITAPANELSDKEVFGLIMKEIARIERDEETSNHGRFALQTA